MKKKLRVKCDRGGGGGSSGRTMDRRSHDDPWVMRVLAFLIADDAAKEHAARPHRTASLPRIVRVVYRKSLPARSKCRCIRRIRIKVDSHSSVSALTPSRSLNGTVQRGLLRAELRRVLASSARLISSRLASLKCILYTVYIGRENKFLFTL